MFEDQIQRRDFLKKTAYAVPGILTLKAMRAFAAVGSGRANNGVGNGVDPRRREIRLSMTDRERDREIRE